MRILAFADNHGEERTFKIIEQKIKASKPEVIVCCGDLTLFGKNLEEILERFDKKNIPFIIVPGNHEDRKLLMKSCDKKKNIIYLHKGIFELKTRVFIGCEVNGFSEKDSEFRTFAKKIEGELKKINPGKIVIVTHAPPHKTLLDEINREHVGSIDLRKFIEKNQPDICFCGHVHENFYKKDMINKTKIINPGPEGMLVNI